MDLLDSSLQKAIYRISDIELPVATSYQILNLKLAIETYETERQKLMQKYGQLDENNVYQFSEHAEDFMKEMNSLLNAPVRFNKIRITDLQGLVISANDLCSIYHLIEH